MKINIGYTCYDSYWCDYIYIYIFHLEWFKWFRYGIIVSFKIMNLKAIFLGGVINKVYIYVL
jgi:hypothetical protein